MLRHFYMSKEVNLCQQLKRSEQSMETAHAKGILGKGNMGSESNAKSGYAKIPEASPKKFLFLQWKYY